jgi:hypothetical protein
MARSKTQKRRYKGGDNERISKLQEVIINIFYYCANKLRLNIPKDITLMKLVNIMQLSAREEGQAYQLFPPNFLTNEYIIQIDTQLKNISDEINALVVNDPLEIDDFEREYTVLQAEIKNILYSELYVNFIIDSDDLNLRDSGVEDKDFDFYDGLIMPELYKIYNIKEIDDDSYLKYTEEEYEAKKDMIRQKDEELTKSRLKLFIPPKI